MAETSHNHDNLGALKSLENFLHPTEFLAWRRRWQANNPNGVRHGFIGDDILIEDHPFSETEDFKIKLGSILKQLKVELSNIKISEFKHSVKGQGSYEEIGLRIQSVLDNAIASNVMKKYIDIIESKFQLLALEVQTELNVQFAFMKNASFAADQIGVNAGVQLANRPVTEDSSKNNIIDPSKSIDPALARPAGVSKIRRKKEKPIRYFADPAEVVHKYLSFLDRHQNPESKLSPTEHQSLLQIMEDMFNLKRQVSPNVTFGHAISGKITQRDVIKAFGHIQEVLLKSNCPEWFVPSMITLFEMNGDELNIYKKLKQDVKIADFR